MLCNAAKVISLLPPAFSPEHYLLPIHRAIHETIVGLDAPDPITVAAAMGADQNDRAYLAQLVAGMVSIVSAPDYARVISEAHHRREVRAVASEMLEQTNYGSADFPASGIATAALTKLDALLSGTTGYSKGISLDKALDVALEHAGKAARGEVAAGRSTGMRQVDQLIGGLEDGTYIVLAARPGVGKTALACQIAVNVARQAKEEKSGGVLGFSLEMPAWKLARRVLAEASRVSITDLRDGKIDGRVPQITAARSSLAGLPMFVEDAGGQNIVAMRQKARGAIRRYGRLALIFVDHIQIVKPEDADRRQGNTQAVGRISNALRDLSKEFECPVLALSQLSRDLLKRDDKRPNLGDLRAAGDIEQDADVVVFLHREEMFLSKKPPVKSSGETEEKHEKRVFAWREAIERWRGKAELIAEKVRDGEPRAIDLNFEHGTTSFSEIIADNSPAPQGNLEDWRDTFHADDPGHPGYF
jgi:replicative DNA helicase